MGKVCKNKSNKQPLFLFSQATRDEVLKEILSLDTTKTCQDTDIPTKILKENADIFSDFLFAYYNASVVNSSKFPSTLTLADIIPVFKKGDKEYKNNYRPVSILPNMSKIFERIIFRQISNYCFLNLFFFNTINEVMGYLQVFLLCSSLLFLPVLFVFKVQCALRIMENDIS